MSFAGYQYPWESPDSKLVVLFLVVQQNVFENI